MIRSFIYGAMFGCLSLAGATIALHKPTHVSQHELINALAVTLDPNYKHIAHPPIPQHKPFMYKNINDLVHKKIFNK